MGYGNRWYENGAKPTTPAAIGAFVRYVRALSSHFKGKVYAYEVWNEWDHTGGNTRPGTAAGYLRLLRAVYPVLKQSDPSALVLGGSLTSTAMQDGYLVDLVRLGALRYMDGLALHPYVQCARQSTVAAWKSWMSNVNQPLTDLAHHSVSLYLTEVG